MIHAYLRDAVARERDCPCRICGDPLKGPSYFQQDIKQGTITGGVVQVTDQNYSFCTDPDVAVTERVIPLSDGAALKVIDFTPPQGDQNGPIVCFVAGWISEINGWEGVLKELTPRYKTLYVESREKKSARIPQRRNIEFSISRMVDDIHEILEATVPYDRSFVFVGSSLGSTTILDYLSRGLRCPALTIAIAPNAEFRIPAWAFFVARGIPPGAYTFVKGFIKWYLGTFRIDKTKEPEQLKKYEGTLDGADFRRLKASALSMKGYSVRPKLPLITSPVVIVGALSDRLHNAEEVKEIAQSIPGAQLEIMESNRATHSREAGLFIVERLEVL